MIQCFKFQTQLKKLIKKLFDIFFIVSKLDNLIEIQLIDTDVLILLLAYIAVELVSNNDSLNLYLKLVTSNLTWYNNLSLIEHLTIDVCKALPYFYAFTGCDTVSSFNGKGKCTFFDTWMESKKKNDLTKTFIKLGNMPESINTVDRNTLKFLVKIVYFGNIKDIEHIILNEMSKLQIHTIYFK